MQPLKFRYLLKPTIWGGYGIAGLKNLPGSRPIGESWEISGLPGNETPVLEGKHEGETLPTLIGQYGARLVGERCLREHGTDFPLLVKFISAGSDLSIQVHPDDAMARRIGRSCGKTEMWYIVDSQPEASIISGFNRSFSAEAVTAALENGDLIRHLNRTPTRRGDCFFIPAGRIHSISAGNLLIEIQQSSNDTFRIYDFDRTDKDGNKRELHVEQAREALDYTACADCRTAYETTTGHAVPLVSCPQFTTRLIRLTDRWTADYAAIDSFVIYIAYEGEARITDSQGCQLTLRAGESVLFPAENERLHIEPATPRFECVETFIG